jgi:hypothetical protein
MTGGEKETADAMREVWDVNDKTSLLQGSSGVAPLRLALLEVVEARDERRRQIYCFWYAIPVLHLIHKQFISSRVVHTS